MYIYKHYMSSILVFGAVDLVVPKTPKGLKNEVSLQVAFIHKNPPYQIKLNGDCEKPLSNVGHKNLWVISWKPIWAIYDKSLTWMFRPFWAGFPYLSSPFGVPSIKDWGTFWDFLDPSLGGDKVVIGSPPFTSQKKRPCRKGPTLPDP